MPIEAGKVNLSRQEKWQVIFSGFCESYRPDMPQDAREKLCSVIWVGSGNNLRHCETILAMCCIESSLKVRKYFPVKNRLDYMGAHNCVYVSCLYKQGIITDSKDWKKSEQWVAMRPSIKENPEYGTYIAVLWYEYLVKNYGGNLDQATIAWNEGSQHMDTQKAKDYLAKVHSMRDRVLEFAE